MHDQTSYFYFYNQTRVSCGVVLNLVLILCLWSTSIARNFDTYREEQNRHGL